MFVLFFKLKQLGGRDKGKTMQRFNSGENMLIRLNCFMTERFSHSSMNLT